MRAQVAVRRLDEVETRIDPVFILPESIAKTSTERVVVLNAVACRVIESRRARHREIVFTYRGKPMGKLNNSGWKRAWQKAGLPTEKGILKGVHNHFAVKRRREPRITVSTLRFQEYFGI